MKSIIVIPLLLVSLSVFSQQHISLEEARRAAAETNMKLINSRLETESAMEVAASVKNNYYPSVSLDVGLMHAINPLLEISSPGGNLPVYDGNPANLGSASEFAYIPASTTGLLQKLGAASLSVTQPIYVGGKIKMGDELSQMGVDVRRKQEVLFKNDVLLETTRQYWQIVSLQEKEKTIEKYEALLDRLSIQVNDAYKAGLIIQNDVYKLELEQNELALNKSKLANGKRLALLQFANTTGIPFDSSMHLIESVDEYESPEYYKLMDGEGYLDRLSEVQLLEKSIQIQQLQTKLKEADYLPTVAFGLNAFYLSQFEENTGGLNLFGFLSASVPISSHWSGKHDVREMVIKEEIARNNLEDTKKLLQLRSEKSWVDLVEAYKQVLIIEDRIIAANENLRVNQSSYDSSVVTLSDLLEAKALQTQALDDLIEAKAKYKVAIAAYLQYTGK
ncbi:TolC family protein [Neolewinella agarilytica]|uniref:Outer membrane protein TolC n=1 Tax=Neolewinella agarilytica TaxID=478744 RepID=A0A1H9MMW9_9BACT|nr:TolC family protein [Neolewinella agarilytica]SER24807.1 Outer membrane protein TolC [Neolewinella agarilytica]